MSDSTTLSRSAKQRTDEGEWARISEILEAQRKLCHNINNPLTAIMGRAQILQLKKGNDPQLNKAADVIEEAAKRVAAYVRELSEMIHQGREVLAGDKPKD